MKHLYLLVAILAGTPYPSTTLPADHPAIKKDTLVVTLVDDSVGRLQCLAARDWKTGDWVTIATDSEGRVITSPETIPEGFMPPDLHEPLWLGTAAEDKDTYSTVILTDKLGRVIVPK